MGARDLGSLVALAALWGASFLFIRVAAPALGPWLLMDLRFLGSVAALLLYAALTRTPIVGQGGWRAYLALGTINGALPAVLVATAALHLTASLGAILNATTPLFAALVAALWLAEPFTARKAAGIGLGTAGVGVLVGWSPLPVNGAVLLAVALSVTATVCYAIAGVQVVRVFQEVPPLSLAVGQQLAAGLVLLPFAAATLPGSPPSSEVILAVVALAVLSTAVAYLLYFQLVQRVGPMKTATVTFLIPVFGLLWGALFLDEPISLGTVVGMLVILAGVVLVTGVRFHSGQHARALPASRG